MELRSARDAGDSAEGWRLCSAALEAVDHGVATGATGATLAGLLDECFMAAWNAGAAHRDTARDIAATYLALATSDPDAREEFLREEIRIRGNFALLGDESPTQ